MATPEAVALVLDPIAPDLILCPGAMTYVDGCEDDPALAFRTNAHGPAAVASYAAHGGIPFVLFSTDYVFSGSADRSGPYAEDDPPHPLNVYGESKLQGERAGLRGGAGVVHVTGPELMSRDELALAVARWSGLDETSIQGVDTPSLRQRVRRPLHSGLRSDRLRGWNPPLTMHGLQDGLQVSGNGPVL